MKKIENVKKRILLGFFCVLLGMISCKEASPYLFAPSVDGGASYTNAGKVVFSWEAVASATKYLYRLEGEEEWKETTELSIEIVTSDSKTYVLEVKAVYVDAEGAVKESSIARYTVMVNHYIPEIPTVVAPRTTNDTTPTWTWTKPEGADLFQYALNEEAWVEVSSNIFQFTPPAPLAEGVYSLKVKAGTLAGNWSEAGEASVIIDLTAPDLPVVEPLSTTVIGLDVFPLTKNPRPEWGWTPVEGADEYRCQLNDEYPSRWISFPSSVERKFVPDFDLDDDDHTLYVQVKDQYGNWSTSSTGVITVDTTAPASPKLLPKDNRVVISSDTVEWSWIPATVGESVLDVVSYQWKLDITADAGNTAGEWVTYGTGTGEDAANPKISFDAFSGDGDYTLFVRSLDVLGNEAEPTTSTITVDSTVGTQPIVWFTSVYGEDSQDVFISGTAPNYVYHTANAFPTVRWEVVGTLYECQWSLDNIVWNDVAVDVVFYEFAEAQRESSEGLTFYVRSKESPVSTWSVPGEATLFVDLTPPAVPIVTGPSIVGTLRPTWTWNEDSDVLFYAYRVNAGYPIYQQVKESMYTPSSDLPGDEVGISYRLEVRARDLVGNWSPYGLHEITINTNTPDPPVVSSVDAITSNPRPMWSWVVSEGSVAVRYRLNGTPSDADSIVDGETFEITELTQTTFTPSVDLQAEGGTSDQILYVMVKDGLGRWSSSGYKTVIVDRESPNAPIVSGPVKTGDLRPTWTWRVAESADVMQFAYKFNDDTGSPANGSDGWALLQKSVVSYTSVNELTDGRYTLYVRATDAVGNWSPSGSCVIEVTTAVLDPPIISLLGDSTVVNGKTYVDLGKPSFSWTHETLTNGDSSDDGDITAYRYRIGANAWRMITDITNREFEPPFNLSQGQNICSVQVRDELEIWSQSGTFEVWFDNQAPVPPRVTSISGTTGDRTPTWTWSHANEDELFKYRYRLGVDPVIDWVEVDKTVTFFVPSANLAEGEYSLQVQARDEVGNWSTPGIFKITVKEGEINYGVPQPINISSVTRGAFSKGIRIEWLADLEAKTYTINRITPAQIAANNLEGTVLVEGVTETSLATGKAGNSYYFYDTSVNEGETYYYRMRGVNPDGVGNLSLYKPEEQIGTAFSGYAGKRVVVGVQRVGYRISWESCLGAMGYYVFRAETDPATFDAVAWGDAIAYVEDVSFYLDTESGANTETDERWYRIVPASNDLINGDTLLSDTALATQYRREILAIGAGYDPVVGHVAYSGYDSDYTVPMPVLTLEPYASQNGYLPGTTTDMGASQGKIRLKGGISFIPTDSEKLDYKLIRTSYYGKEVGIYPLAEPDFNGGVTHWSKTKPLNVRVVEYNLADVMDVSGNMDWTDPMPVFDENGTIEAGKSHVWNYAAWDREGWKYFKRRLPFDMNKSVKVTYQLIVQRKSDPNWDPINSTFEGWPELTDKEFLWLASWMRECAFNRLWKLQIPRWNWRNTLPVLALGSGIAQKGNGEHSGYANLAGSGLSGNGHVVDYSDWGSGFKLETKDQNGTAVPIALKIDTAEQKARFLSFWSSVTTPLYSGTIHINVAVRDYGFQWGISPIGYDSITDNGAIKMWYRGREHTFENPTDVFPVGNMNASNEIHGVVFDNNPYGYETFDYTGLPYVPSPYTRYNYLYRPEPMNSAAWHNTAAGTWQMSYGFY